MDTHSNQSANIIINYLDTPTIRFEDNMNNTVVYINDIKTYQILANSTVNIQGNNLHAIGSARLYTYGNGNKINLLDRSLAIVYGNDIVTLCHYSIVTLYGSQSSAVAIDESTVTALSTSTVTANVNATVHACAMSTVYACEQSKVIAESSQCIIHAAGQSSIYTSQYFPTIYASNFATIYSSYYENVIKDNYFGQIISPVVALKAPLIVYKKLRNNRLATLQLEPGQTFQSQRGGKCRTDRAFVLKIESLNSKRLVKTGRSLHTESFLYEVGKTMIAEGHDSSIHECSTGIHFFLTRKEAEEYV